MKCRLFIFLWFTVIFCYKSSAQQTEEAFITAETLVQEEQLKTLENKKKCYDSLVFKAQHGEEFDYAISGIVAEKQMNTFLVEGNFLNNGFKDERRNILLSKLKDIKKISINELQQVQLIDSCVFKNLYLTSYQNLPGHFSSKIYLPEDFVESKSIPSDQKYKEIALKYAKSNTTGEVKFFDGGLYRYQEDLVYINYVVQSFDPERQWILLKYTHLLEYKKGWLSSAVIVKSIEDKKVLNSSLLPFSIDYIYSSELNGSVVPQKMSRWKFDVQLEEGTLDKGTINYFKSEYSITQN